MERQESHSETVLKTDKSTLPITVYDIFGYFVPAITAVSCIYIMESWGRNVLGQDFYPVLLSLMKALPMVPDAPSVLVSLLVGTSLICLLYVFGHLIASISSLFVDRFLIFRGLGYPYERILRTESQQSTDNESLRYCVQAWFCCFHLTLVLTYVQYFFNIDTLIIDVLRKSLLAPEELNVVLQISLVAIGYLILIGMIFYFASITYLLFEQMYFYQVRNDEVLLSESMRDKVERLTRLPRILPTTLATLMHRRRQLPEVLARRFAEAFKDEFKISRREADTCCFWFCEMFISEHAPGFHKRLMSWLHLYSFARNLSTAFFLLFIYSAGLLIVNYDLVFSPHADRQMDFFLIKATPLAFLVMSIILLIRYYYLYSCYYSAFLFRTFLYLKRNGS